MTPPHMEYVTEGRDSPQLREPRLQCNHTFCSLPKNPKEESLAISSCPETLAHLGYPQLSLASPPLNVSEKPNQGLWPSQSQTLNLESLGKTLNNIFKLLHLQVFRWIWIKQRKWLNSQLHHQDIPNFPMRGQMVAPVCPQFLITD